MEQWKGKHLRDCALAALREGEPAKKAALTFQVAEAFRRGYLVIDTPPTPFNPADVPIAPVRSDRIKMVDPRKVKGNSKKAMLHSVVHAESYAMDLAWDLIARFGWEPSLWPSSMERRGRHGAPVTAAPVTAATSTSTSAAGVTGAGASAATGNTLPASPAERMPDDFFADWVRVADDEARHYSKWASRLAELGAVHGDLPAHAGLWESAEETAHSMPARLAVVHCVHEARGLDVAPIMRAKLAAGDDVDSLAILDANVADEITHVGAGRKWLEWYARRTGEEVIPLYHSLVRVHFYGLLRPPFNDAARAGAGMTRDWYEPLATSTSSAPQGEGEEEAAAADMA